MTMSDTLQNIISKLDTYLEDVSLLKTEQRLINERLAQAEIRAEQCQERSCTKIFKLEQDLIKHCDSAHKKIEQVSDRHIELDIVVREHDNDINRIKEHHNRHHKGDEL